MSTFKKARRNPSGGGAAVEFALVLPIFLALVMGALDYGYYFFSAQVVTGAAREGARAGTMVDPSKGFGVAQPIAEQAAKDYMNNNNIGCPSGGTTCITVTNPPLNVTSGGVVVLMNGIDVIISYQFKSLTGFSSIMVPHNVAAHAVMRWN
jgi:Flp pilus assembly protein TadG